MASSNKKSAKTRILILFIISLIVLALKAYYRLPYSQSYISGHGLYTYINKMQSFEMALTTFLCIFLVCKFIFRCPNKTIYMMATGFSALNFGLMVLDVRMHSYNIFIEQYIQLRYGDNLKIYLIAFTAITVGILLIKFSSKGLTEKAKK